jgi:hypothetical protein
LFVLNFLFLKKYAVCELPPALAGGMKIGNYLMALAKRYIWLKPI